jgi:hypothetical protein
MENPSLTDILCQAVTGRLPARNIHEIQSCIFAICRRIESASEEQRWQSVHNLADGLRDLAERGMYHASQARVKEIGQFALGNHQESESR